MLDFFQETKELLTRPFKYIAIGTALILGVSSCDEKSSEDDYKKDQDTHDRAVEYVDMILDENKDGDVSLTEFQAASERLERCTNYAQDSVTHNLSVQYDYKNVFKGQASKIESVVLSTNSHRKSLLKTWHINEEINKSVHASRIYPKVEKLYPRQR